MQVFHAPATPKSPRRPGPAAGLKEYEAMAVEVEGQEAAPADGAGAKAAAVEDWLVEDEDDAPAAAVAIEGGPGDKGEVCCCR